jgi:hypothetical protein
MNSRTLFSLAFLFSCIFPTNASSQTDTCSNYLVPVVVRNAQGAMIRDLAAQDLEVKVGGNKLSVESISLDTRPRRTVILLDSSGSMRGYGKEVPWRQAIASAQLLASLSEGRVRLALLIFNEKILEEIGFANDNSAITKRLSELENDQSYMDRTVHGGTHINDALNRGLELLKEPTSADALYVASGAYENGSHLTQAQIEHKAVDAGVRVFLGITRTPGSISGWMRTPEILPEFPEVAEYTGGRIMFLQPAGMDLGFEVHPKPTLIEGLRLFFEAMFANQALQLATPGFGGGKRDLKIVASHSSQDRLKHARYFYPRQLYKCLPQTVSSR